LDFNVASPAWGHLGTNHAENIVLNQLKTHRKSLSKLNTNRTAIYQNTVTPILVAIYIPQVLATAICLNRLGLTGNYINQN